MNKKPVKSRTPFRITLAGHGTDTIWYSKLRGGEWISAAIDKYIYVFAKYIPSDYIFLNINGVKGQYLHVDKVPDDIVQETLSFLKIKSNIKITIKSDIPLGSGLGGSGSFCVGLLNCLYKIKGSTVSKEKLAKKACNIEIKKLKRPIGPQDQYAASYGGLNSYSISRNGTVKVQRLNIPRRTISELKNCLFLVSTKIRRRSSDVLGDEAKKMKIQGKRSNDLRLTLDLVKDLGKLVKLFLLEGKTEVFASSLNCQWFLKKSLSKKVSNRKIDDLYNFGIINGALGGIILGAGGGGWMMFYVPQSKNKSFKKCLTNNSFNWMQVNFDWKGSRIIK